MPTLSFTSALPISTQRILGAMIFDVDGVIADTARLHTAAWRCIANDEGIPFDDETADALRGLSRGDSLRRLLNGRTIDPDRFAALCDRKNAVYVASLDRLTPAETLPGVRALIADLRNMDIRCAAASASRNARNVLECLDMSSMFDEIIDGNDEAEHTTQWHRYLLAARAMRVEPSRCAVIEDSAAGIAAARQFGMRCIGIGSPADLHAATLVFESLRGVNAACLLRWLDR